MQQAELLSWLRHWEQSLPVRDWRAAGVEIWPLVRIGLGQSLQGVGAAAAAVGGGQTQAPAPPRFAKHRALLDLSKPASAALRDFGHNGSLLRKADAVFLTHTSNRQWVHDAYYDMFFDPLFDVLEQDGHTALALEASSYPSRYRVPRHKASLFTQPVDLWMDVQGALLRVLGRAGTEPVLPGYDRLGAELQALGARALLPSPAMLLWQASRIARLTRFFERVLQHSGAKLAMTACYYSAAGMALHRAARAQGLEAVDLQHGVISEHPAFTDLSSVPAAGWELLPKTFWCWSPADAAVIERWSSAGSPAAHRAIVGGQPWTCVWQDDGDPLTQKLSARIQTERAHGPNALTVLLSLQWDLGLTDLMKQVILRAPGSWRFWLRLHPLMDQPERKALAAWVQQAGVASRCDIDNATDSPLPLLLRFADVHWTRHSTVVQEAAAAAVGSVVNEPAALEVYRAQAQAGWVIAAYDVEETLAALLALAPRARNAPAHGSLGTPHDMHRALRGLLG